MRCPRCGNENPDDNRFCGMCGATLLAAPAIAETATQRAASAGTALPSSSPEPVSVLRPPAETLRAPVRESHESDETPIISGPSFLGLSDPNPRKRASLRSGSHDSRSSRNLDYLLEDEPEEEGGSAGKVILILAVLAVAAAFGYMTWKNHGVGWLSAILSKPAAQAQAPSETGTSAPPVSPPNPVPESQPQPAAQTSPPPATTQPPVSDNTKPASPSPPATAPPNHEDSKPAGAANPSADEEEDTSAESNAQPAPVAKPANPKPANPAPAVETPSPKPHAAVAPAKSFDPVSEAQKYLYGRGGVAQDCDRGLKLLKPAANAANPKAMIEMGALYSAGLCTPRDLPTAYRWFAIALRKDPENDAVQRDLQKLWGEMTQPERQLAIKLTQ